ncbi:phosphotransferase enzyme family protein [Marinobacterium stanieri]|uniref:phosphotransferase enzyme family protein n=1 Tax=Marinobacterium stanieri TaxID=49186 RepID=UPI003A8F0E4F
MYTDTLVNTLKVELGQCLNYWRMPTDARVDLLTTSENATFISHDCHTDRKIIIRVHRPDYHEQQEIESELAWISDLRTSGQIETPAPIETTHGSPVVSIKADGREFFVVGFEHVSGAEPDVGQSLPSWFEKLGAVTATLHQHSRDWQPPDWFMRKRWTLDTMIAPDGLWGDWRDAPGLSADDEAVINQAIGHIEREIEAYGLGDDRYGLVHADLRLANLLVDGDRMSIIDFDDSGFCWYAYDFAAAISFYELDPIIPQLREAWVKGYRSVAEFSDEDEALLETFVMIRRIMLTAWLASHADSEAAQELIDGYAEGTAQLARAYLQGRP